MIEFHPNIASTCEQRQDRLLLFLIYEILVIIITITYAYTLIEMRIINLQYIYNYCINKNVRPKDNVGIHLDQQNIP